MALKISSLVAKTEHTRHQHASTHSMHSAHKQYGTTHVGRPKHNMIETIDRWGWRMIIQSRYRQPRTRRCQWTSSIPSFLGEGAEAIVPLLHKVWKMSSPAGFRWPTPLSVKYLLLENIPSLVAWKINLVLRHALECCPRPHRV
mmetsp:Transcript_89657/g.196454  ORF Transcript_89657/g.196454 Transcript_89657/m.196454 type:complete len:144 (-) Transcript_89657:438-869(-)